MKLTPCENPLAKRKPKWLEWQPIISEFLESGSECSRIDEHELTNSDVSHIRECISRAYRGEVSLHVLKGVPYLTREMRERDATVR